MGNKCTFIPTCHPQAKPGARGLCKKCYIKQYYSYSKSQACKERYINKRYGITKSEFTAVLLKQDNKCAICKKEFGHIHRDHNHVTGKFRGLLCINCNIGIGNLKDSISNLESAITYLRGDEKPV